MHWKGTVRRLRTGARLDLDCSSDLQLTGLRCLAVQTEVRHPWQNCSFKHQGEKASRRDLFAIRYSSKLCPFADAGCPNGDACLLAHNVGATAVTITLMLGVQTLSLLAVTQRRLGCYSSGSSTGAGSTNAALAAYIRCRLLLLQVFESWLHPSRYVV